MGDKRRKSIAGHQKQVNSKEMKTGKISMHNHNKFLIVYLPLKNDRRNANVVPILTKDSHPSHPWEERRSKIEVGEMKGRTNFYIQLLRTMRSEKQAEKQKSYIVYISFAVDCSALYLEETKIIFF